MVMPFRNKLEFYMTRMKILNRTEQEAFDKPPVFSSDERKCFFDFPKNLLRLAHGLINPYHKIVFLLTSGYFRATKRFFLTEKFHKRDIHYVMNQLGIGIDSDGYSIIHDIPETTRRRHRKLILNYYCFRLFDQNACDSLSSNVSEMARRHLKPRLIFWRSVDFLVQMRVVVPNYHQISELIIKILGIRKQELTAVIEKALSEEVRSVLDGLFAQEQSSKDKSSNPKYFRYKLTLLKKLSHSTKPVKVKERAGDLLYIKTLYDRIDGILSLLQLTHDAIRYYAKGVIKADIFQLNQRGKEDRYIHAIAFITHQYYRLQDNLTDVLLTVTQSFRNSALRRHRDWCYENKVDYDQSLKSFFSILDDSLFSTVSDIGAILKEINITDTEKVLQIQTLVNNNQATIEKAKTLQATINADKDDEQYYKILSEHSLRLQNRVSPIIKVLDFAKDSESDLIKAISYYKAKDGNITKHAPVSFLEKEQIDAIAPGGKFQPSLYKVFLFMHIASAVKSGTLNLKHSYKYRSMDDYLISKKRWEQDKQLLISHAGLGEFIDPANVLQQLGDSLCGHYQITNINHLDDKNPYLKVLRSGAFTIATPKQDENSENMALKPFFPEQHLVPLCEILSTVNRHSGFLKEFQHWQQQYINVNAAKDKVIYAGIIGKGCAIGTQRIARISSQINANNLDHVVNWYFSLENLQAANDSILKLLDKMELPDVYRRSKDRLHSASDGQKSEVQTESLNANFSFKYFGKNQGVSIYTFVDERHFLWHSLVFSAAERESAYVIDGLMHNDVVKSDIHSTDTHGYSETIFAVTHLLGFTYAPRIKNLKKQSLYIFKSKQKDPKWKILPDKYVNEQIIQETWDDILRLVCTIKLKETSASEIFRRLNSYSKQHRLYQGLKAFGQIIKSQFILHYLDDVAFRQSIEKQLNKVELSNKFTKSVSVGDSHGFTQAEREDQEVAESCNRLIKNSIICWNYLYLSDRLERLADNPKQHETLMTAITTHSVMSWAHVNMLGEYDFSDEKLADSFNIRPPKLRA